MALRFQPQFGQVLICDFPKEFAPPEMIKRRPVVCVSPKVRNRFGIATVIPLSTTAPARKSAFNVEVTLSQPISPAYPDLTCWAKCDMVYTLSWSRLNPPKVGACNGSHQYNFIVLPPGTMCEILTGVLVGMGVTGSVRYENNIYSVFDFQSVL